MTLLEKLTKRSNISPGKMEICDETLIIKFSFQKLLAFASPSQKIGLPHSEDTVIMTDRRVYIVLYGFCI